MITRSGISNFPSTIMRSTMTSDPKRPSDGSHPGSSASLPFQYTDAHGNQPPMNRLQDIERQLESLSRAEKALLLGTLVREMGDSFPGIESTPDVCGGEPCIVRTRIPVWVLEAARRQGISESDLLKSYPSLRAEDLAQAWAFVHSHVEAIEKQIADNEGAWGGGVLREREFPAASRRGAACTRARRPHEPRSR